eukprot:COSAG02_NODE_2174_length_9589_cov_49.732561_14_plen_118_part_00
MLPPVADSSVLAVSIQPAVIEAVGNIGAAIAAKLSFLNDGNSAQLASDKRLSRGAQPVAVSASTHDAESLQTQYDTLRSILVSAVDFEENYAARSAATRRLESVNQHLQDFKEEEIT